MENEKAKNEDNYKTFYVTKEQLEKGVEFGPEDNKIKLIIVDNNKNISK